MGGSGRRSWWPGPRLVSLLVGGAAAVLVLYPIAYLIQASLSVGDPQARPPEAYGLGNYADLGRYAHIFGNTLLVAVVATVLAIVFGFTMGWILSRTNVPGPAAASSTRSGGRSGATVTSSTSTRPGGSPG